MQFRDNKPDTRACVELACLLEATARKPGNVHPGRRFADFSYADLLKVAVAVGPILADAGKTGVGRAILDAIRASRSLTNTNVNLGIVILLSPLCAAIAPTPDAVADVLAKLTIDDARFTFEAIRIAQPGGLGISDEQDVGRDPTITLLQAMRLATERDMIARQYDIGFTDIFQFGAPTLAAAATAGLEAAIVFCHLRWMAKFPDSLIARKCGKHEAELAAERAGRIVERFSTDTSSLRKLMRDPGLADLDRWLLLVGNKRNPGTSADLVAASLFWALRTGTIELRAPW